MDIVLYNAGTGLVSGYQRSTGTIPAGDTLVWDAPNDTHNASQVNYFNSLRSALDALVGVPIKYWKVVSLLPVEMTQAEKDAIAQAESTALTASIRAGAKAQLDGFSDIPLYQRAVADVLNSRLNDIATLAQGIKTAIENGSNLAAVKTAVGQLASISTSVTLAQAKTAIKNRVDDESVRS